MSDALETALRDWADYHYMIAAEMARQCISAPPGEDPRDWRNQLNPLSVRVMDEAMAAGVWAGKESVEATR